MDCSLRLLFPFLILHYTLASPCGKNDTDVCCSVLTAQTVEVFHMAEVCTLAPCRSCLSPIPGNAELEHYVLMNKLFHQLESNNCWEHTVAQHPGYETWYVSTYDDFRYQVSCHLNCTFTVDPVDCSGRSTSAAVAKDDDDIHIPISMFALLFTLTYAVAALTGVLITLLCVKYMCPHFRNGGPSRQPVDSRVRLGDMDYLNP